MLRNLVIFGLFLGFLVVAFGAGYIVRADPKSPVTELVIKVQRKLSEIQGKPTPEEAAVATIESTFIRFEGTLYPLPETNYIRGGALTIWGEHLVLVTQLGRILKFTEENGLTELPIETPPNGRRDYVAISKTEKYASYLHKPNSMRYNDIQYVDRPDFHGFLLSYTFFDGDRECYGSRIARMDVDRAVASVDGLTASGDDWDVIFETTPCLELDPNLSLIHI